MDKIEQAFKKLFGDMYLSESETALRIFEYGYKAGLEEAAKICNEMVAPMDSYSSFEFAAKRFSDAIRERVNEQTN